jgi:hypothetical protein
MSRSSLIALAIAGTVIGGAAAPALAAPDTHVCLIATHDKTNPGPSALCVVIPVDQR